MQKEKSMKKLLVTLMALLLISTNVGFAAAGSEISTKPSITVFFQATPKWNELAVLNSGLMEVFVGENSVFDCSNSK